MRKLLVPLLLACLAGCASMQPARKAAQAPAAVPDATAALLGVSLPPASFGGTAAFDQQISGMVEGNEASLRFRVEIRPERLVMVGFSPLGFPLFTLTHADGRLDVQTTGGRALPFDPRFVLVDFQLAFWPVDALAPALAVQGLRLEAENARRRVLGPDGAVMAEVTFSAGDDAAQLVSIRHTEPAYEVRVRSHQTDLAS